MNVSNGSPIVVALDFPDEASSLHLLNQLDPALCRLKVGKEMFTRLGPKWVERLQKMGFDVFLDLKFHDIPNTVAAALRVSADLGVWMVNVHASGGRSMLTAAAESISHYATRPILTAVTVLTSMDERELTGIGIGVAPEAQVERLAKLSHECGIDGVVCSAREVGLVKRACGSDFLTVTPGIRPEGSELGDQKRVMTPPQAIAAGVDFMVIGRPITRASDPLAALRDIHASLSAENSAF